MKIAIITYHRVYNYGAVLQAYATVKYLEQAGHEAVIIDYIPEKVRNYGSFHQTFYETQLFHKSKIKSTLIAILKMKSYKIKARIFDNFINQSLPITCEYFSENELINKLPKADLYCTGSDQVWNNTYLPMFDFVYFLSFVKSDRKFAFSASFGRKDFTEAEIEQMTPYLKQYKAISVREKSGLELISSLNVPVKDMVVDPTLLISLNEWKSLVTCDVNYSSYVLVYQLHGNSHVEEMAIKIAKSLGKKTVKIVTDEYKRSNCDYVVKFPTVNMFLSLFKHSDFVVTDSFHGTAFSINFNIPFVVRTCGSTSERIYSILDMTELNGRIANTDTDGVNIANQDIDFDTCNIVLAKQREDALKFLKSVTDIFVDEFE